MTIEELRDQAHLANQANDWHGARNLYQQIVSSGRAGFWDHFGLARATLYVVHLPAAEALITSLQALEGADMAAVAGLRAELAERKGDAAAAVLWAAARKSGGSPYWTTFGQARVAAHSGKIREAKKLMQQALTCSEAEDGGLRYALGVDLKLGDRNAAEEKFNRLGATLSERTEVILGALPGMTSLGERMAMYRAAREMTGSGAIVDVGTFLGSLTVAMAQGLAENQNARERGILVHAYDRFLWHGPMDSFWWDVFPGQKPQPRESFRRIFDYVIKDWAELIMVIEDDILNQRWDSRPIEVLSIDAMKTVEIARHVIVQFMPNLLPGALMLHQDFSLDSTWWIHIYQYLLRHRFEVADKLPGASGLIFRLMNPVLQSDIDLILNHDLADAEIADKAFAYSMSISDPLDHMAIAASHIYYHREMRNLSRMDELTAEYGI